MVYQTTHGTEAAILQRMIDPESETLDPSLARHILTLDFKPADHERMDDLAAKAQESALTEDEKTELESYLNIGHFLALLQSKARLSLRNADAAV